MTVFVAITGASGAIYAARAIEALGKCGVRICATISPTGAQIISHELGLQPKDLGGPNADVTWYAFDDLSALPASGSTCADAMLVIPWSMGTVGRIASGVSDSLVARAADVCLKERKPLVIVPREAPLSLIHLRNLTTIAEAGGVVLPASPHFYDRPESIDDLAATVVGRALAQLGVPGAEQPTWRPDEVL